MFNAIKRFKDKNIYSRTYYLADYRSDIENLPTNAAKGKQEGGKTNSNAVCGLGSVCRVSEDSSVWLLNNQNEWVEQESGSLSEDDIIGIIRAMGIEDGANNIIVDSELSKESENPVQNKIITEAINELTEAVSSDLERFLSAYFALRKTGKIYQTKLYKFASNPTSTGEKLLDNEGLSFTSSTDTAEGTDDYANIPLFDWWHCNYIRDENGDPYITAIKGAENYAEEGLVDVGAMGMTFYWNVDTSNEDYDLWTISDSPNDDYGLVPWCESVRSDGTVAPYWCHSAFVSTTDTEDGLPRSLPYKKIAVNVSHNSIIEDYQKKGAGYWGAGISRNTFQMIFNVIMGATKDSQSLYYGNVNWSFQYTAAVEREENDIYFPVTAEQAATLEVGLCVSVGYMSGSGSVNLNYENMYKYARGVKITAVEALNDDGGNYAVYLDVDEGFPTAQVTVSDDITSQVYMSSWHCYSGETNSVLGRHNGSPVSNTSGRHPYRVQGTEYMNGAYVIASDTVGIYGNDYSLNIYAAEKGVSHSSTQSVIENTYKLVGTAPTIEYADSESSYITEYIGDIAVDMSTGAWWPSDMGASTANGWADKFYFDHITSGIREYLQGGYLSHLTSAGSAFLNCDNALSSSFWYFCACD
ncbi:MAG: hypothetical protein LUD77_06135 [Clostridiales bacterium]|nr:hypothetical protein [Clostridiales bacterium]